MRPPSPGQQTHNIYGWKSGLPTLKYVCLPVISQSEITQLNDQPADDKEKDINNTGNHLRQVPDFYLR